MGAKALNDRLDLPVPGEEPCFLPMKALIKQKCNLLNLLTIHFLFAARQRSAAGGVRAPRLLSLVAVWHALLAVSRIASSQQ